MGRRKKKQSNLLGWAILGVIGFAIIQFGVLQPPQPSRATSAASAPRAVPVQSQPPAPLSQPRYVSAASLNVRHTPSTSGPLVGTLPKGTQLKVLDRQNGWLLVDLGPTLEGWVSERLTTTEAPKAGFVPPAALKNDR